MLGCNFGIYYALVWPVNKYTEKVGRKKNGRIIEVSAISAVRAPSMSIANIFGSNQTRSKSVDATSSVIVLPNNSKSKDLFTVSIYDLISHKEGYYIFMEYVSFISLLSLLSYPISVSL